MLLSCSSSFLLLLRAHPKILRIRVRGQLLPDDREAHPELLKTLEALQEREKATAEKPATTVQRMMETLLTQLPPTKKTMVFTPGTASLSAMPLH